MGKMMKAFAKLGVILRLFSIRSVGIKLFLIFFISIAVFVSAVGLFAYDQSKNLIKEEVGAFSTIATVEMADKLRMTYQHYERLLLRLTVEQPVKDAYEAFLTGEPETDKQFTSVLSNMTNTDKYVKSVKFIRPDGKLIHSIGSLLMSSDQLKGSEKTRTRDHNFDYNEFGWFTEAVKRNGDVLWIASEPIGMVDDGANVPAFGLARAVKNVEGKQLYILLLEVNYNAIQDQFKSLALGEGTRKLVVNSDNRVIYADDIALLAQQSPIANPIQEGTKSGSSEYIVEDTNMLVSYARSYDNNDWHVVTAIPSAELTKNAKVILDALTYVLLLAFVVAVLIGIYMILSIGRPLKKLKALMAQAEQGELSVRSKLRRKDEIGQLGVSFNHMLEQITELIKQVKASVDEVRVNAEQVTTVSRDNASMAKEVAVSMEEIARGSGELATRADEGYESAGHINSQMSQAIEVNQGLGQTAEQVAATTHKGAAYMGELLEHTQESERQTQIMFEKVDALKESTDSIRKVLDLLNGITKQTNILSLNASIEASRAGEAGRGFKVVADEIRKLADQSRESIEVVDRITEQIEGHAIETIRVIENVKPIFQKQVSSVQQTGSILKDVEGEMGSFVSQLEQVTVSFQQLEASQSRLTESITSVSAVAEEASATTQQVAALTSQQLKANDELTGLAVKLKQLSESVDNAIRKFKF